MAGKIFISYRRSETAWAARAVFERLRRVFPDDVFIDLEGISPGIDFVKVIGLHLEGCHAMMAMIGAEWLREIHDRGPDHLAHTANEEDGAPDHVRIELAQALSRGIPVVPVLVDEARMPAAKDLPPDLKALARRHAVDLPWKFFEAQMGLLEKELRKVMPAGSAAPGKVATAPAASPAVQRRECPAWACEEGDDSHGRWAALEVAGVRQVMRWIEPGTFWMGSPNEEPERSDDEVRHRVRLTKGFWLADTACSQALWEAVVGHNPSQFTGDLQLPVEQVSWNDVTQQFLPALNRKLPGLNGRLPTEAEWEYACRAGTSTPFFWSEPITPEKLNYDGNHPYNGAAKGLYRKRTVPVKEFRPNAWGLYQMHGNVREWCQDVYAAYPPAEVADPTGPQDGVEGRQRVLRGGSWIGNGWDCRSADRSAFVPDERFVYFGFRLARGGD